MKKVTIFALSLLAAVSSGLAQPAPKPYGQLPSARQVSWQETEMYCIIHFSMATFEDKEWGYGDEPVSLFNPAHFNAMQIVGAAKAGGFKGIVVVAKHHDGFCLWPTKTTDHNISNSPWKHGKGDILKEYQLACQKLGMKMGVYCSPWDRNNALYGKPQYVTEVYRKQLKELYANYGSLFMSWHDGANGGDGYYGGAREVRKIDKGTYYGWPQTWGITRAMQPGASIFGDVGPDVRWVGNEEGHAGETCWETFTPHAETGDIPSNGNVKYWESTNGMRDGKFWMPAECDVPLRPGWFYHQMQDGQTKSPSALLDLYYKSVGRGACLDLGLSPNKAGVLSEEDVKALATFGRLLNETFKVNLAKGAQLTANNIRGKNKLKYGPANLLDNNRYSYWATDDQVTNPILTMTLPRPTTFNVIRLRENIKLGQRIDSVAVEAYLNGNWKEIAKATSIGANRLIRLNENTTASKLRLKISAPVCIALSDVGLFKEPPILTMPEVNRSREGMVSLAAGPRAVIHYTTDGAEPTIQSPVYSKPFSFKTGGTIKAKSFEEGQGSELKTTVFDVIKAGWKVLQMPEAEQKAAEKAIDDNASTFFVSAAGSSKEFAVDMGESHQIKAFTYLPRQDRQAIGIVSKYRFLVSDNGTDWKQVAEGEFSNIKSNPVLQTVALKAPVNARYFKLAVSGVVEGSVFSIAELGIEQ